MEIILFWSVFAAAWDYFHCSFRPNSEPRIPHSIYIYHIVHPYLTLIGARCLLYGINPSISLLSYQFYCVLYQIILLVWAQIVVTKYSYRWLAFIYFMSLKTHMSIVVISSVLCFKCFSPGPALGFSLRLVLSHSWFVCFDHLIFTGCWYNVLWNSCRHYWCCFRLPLTRHLSLGFGQRNMISCPSLVW